MRIDIILTDRASDACINQIADYDTCLEALTNVAELTSNGNLPEHAKTFMQDKIVSFMEVYNLFPTPSNPVSGTSQSLLARAGSRPT